MAESIEAFIAPLIFLALAAIFYFVIELRIKMLKCRE